MKTVHIRAEGLSSEHTAASIEMQVRAVPGVRDVAAVRSLRLISVLYDEHVARRSQILTLVRRAGYRARPYPRRRDIGAARHAM